MKKITFIDLDGTLLNDDSKLSIFSKIILKEYRKKSYLFAVTARSKNLTGIKNDIENIFDGFVFHNGAEIYYNDRLIYKNHLSKNELKEIWEILSFVNCKISIITDDIYFANYDASEYWNDIYNLQIIKDITEINNTVPKVNILIENDNQIEYIKNKFDKSNKYRIEFTDNQKFCIIEKSNSSKGNSVIKIKKHLNNNFSETIGIGNDDNDITMLKECDTKLCVGNSSKNLIDIADKVLETNNNDGVAKFLNNYLDHIKVENLIVGHHK
ncbi:MAG: HAD family hydrolase [Acetobacter sp.]|nr:HAD family hydrolase [Bacteroides sp.]MCM1340793.1 HAD family hydrolase [Acetobacter sp.]MCM1432650.1 HAD family hydrolase [Clostridiales bacterium]